MPKRLARENTPTSKACTALGIEKASNGAWRSPLIRTENFDSIINEKGDVANPAQWSLRDCEVQGKSTAGSVVARAVCPDQPESEDL